MNHEETKLYKTEQGFSFIRMRNILKVKAVKSALLTGLCLNGNRGNIRKLE